MRAFKLNGRKFRLLLAAILCTTVIPFRSLADDRASSNLPAKSALAKPDSPVPLTERERWMLDRMEQLEKRVAELESKGNLAVASDAATSSTNVSTVAARNGANSSVLPVEKGVASVALPGTSAQTKSAKTEPFAFADFTWLNGNARTKELAMDTKLFTPEIRADVDYVYDFAHPKDDTIGGSSEVFRSSEVQVTQLGVGGDFHYDNVRARLMTQFGLYSQTTPRNDASPFARAMEPR